MGACCASGDSLLRDAEFAKKDKNITHAYRAKVVRTIDGDGVVLVHRYLGIREYPLIQENVRLLGIDAPETCVGPTNPLRTEIKAAGQCAKLALAAKIQGKIVDVVVHGSGRYGRPLVMIRYRGTGINQWMIDNHYAVAYDGSTKCTDAVILGWCTGV